MKPTRRQVVSGLIASSAVGLVGATSTTRPNILLIIADDWGWTSALARDELGLKMPNFDRLKRAGVFATQAFAASPSCTASRGAILTGRPIFQLEEGAQLASILKTKFVTYPDILERAGYFVGSVGKGWAPGMLAPTGRTRDPAGPTFGSVDDFLARCPKDRPFCLWVGSDRPHRHYERGRGAQLGITPRRLPHYLPDSAEVRSDVADYMAEAQRFDAEIGPTLASVEARGGLENTIVIVTGDNGWPFPRGKATLYDSGTHVPFVACWPKRLPRATVCRSFISLADIAPTLLAAAGVTAPPEMTASNLLPALAGLSYGADHVITAMERHMNVHTVPLQGFPMRALRTRQHLLICNLRPERWPAGDPPLGLDVKRLETDYYAGFSNVDPGPAKAWLVANKDRPDIRRYAQFALGKRPSIELYDVRTDPYQLSNLAMRRSHAAIANVLNARLMAELKRLSDPRMSADPDIFDRYPAYNGPGWERPSQFPN